MPAGSDEGKAPALKMLLRHGTVYPKPTTWKQDHRKWLADQPFDEPTSELVYLADLLARVDALTARKLQLRADVVLPTARSAVSSLPRSVAN